MKKILLAAAALALFASPALAQKVRVNSQNTATSGSLSYGSNSINYAPYSKVDRQIPGASSAIPAVSQSQWSCTNAFSVAVPYFGIGVPVEGQNCAAIAAAAAYRGCSGDRVCLSILSQNEYVRRGLEANQQPAAVYTVTGSTRPAPAPTGRADYATPGSPHYSPNLR